MIRRFPLLWVSLALNAFLAALVGAHLVRAAATPATPRGLDAAIARMASVLPDADAAQFRAVLARERPSYEPAHQRVDAMRVATAGIIGQKPYDPDALRAAMQNWQASWHDFSVAFSASLLKAIGTLSPEGRARLAALLEQPPRP